MTRRASIDLAFRRTLSIAITLLGAGLCGCGSGESAASNAPEAGLADASSAWDAPATQNDDGRGEAGRDAPERADFADAINRDVPDVAPSNGDAGASFPPRGFSLAGDMLTPRWEHTSTLLLDGKVILAGGDNSSGAFYLDAAELYDPVTGTFSATASMNVPRTRHSATLLKDGRVLVAGSYRVPTDATSTDEPSAEIYDPTTATFAEVSPMATGRQNHTATLLLSGLVLVAGGGELRDKSHLATAELFDPSLGRFRPTGAMSVGRSGHTAMLLKDGTVLVMGGAMSPSAEIYDPATETFALVGSTTAAGQFSVATLLADNRVLIVNESTGESELFSPDGNSVEGPSIELPPYGLSKSVPITSTLLPDGTVLLNGSLYLWSEGISGSYQQLTGLFSPDDGSLIPITSSSPALATSASRATLLPNGGVLFTGLGTDGNSPNAGTRTTAVIYY
jgi:hypothetical protein